MTWQPIDAVPADARRVLVWVPNVGVCIGQYAVSEWSPSPRPYWSWSLVHSVDAQRKNQPTHWMPLPEAPGVSP